MNVLELPERDIRIDIPSHWDEMSPEQIKYCLKQAYFASLDIISVPEARLRVFYYLADIEVDSQSIRWARIQSPNIVQDKNSKVFLLAEQLCSFLFSPGQGGRYEINYDTVINHFPVIKAGGQVLHGPASLLSDLTFAEFRTAIEEMEEYFSTKAEIHLSRMIACLYRPMRKDWDSFQESDNFDGKMREPFNRARLDANALYTAKIGAVDRTAFLLWFTYSLNYLQTQDLSISGRVINLSILFPQGKKRTADLAPELKGSGWTGLLYVVAEQAVFGTIESTDKAGLFDILLYLYDKEIENQKQKSKQKAKR